MASLGAVSRLSPGRCLLPLAIWVAPVAAVAAGSLQFDFGGGTPAPGFTAVRPENEYARERGHGFEPGSTRVSVAHDSADPLRDGHITSATPFHFSARVPQEGNYRVTVTLGDAREESVTTIKAELRRLMVAERIRTAPGEFRRVSFIVNASSRPSATSSCPSPASWSTTSAPTLRPSPMIPMRSPCRRAASSRTSARWGIEAVAASASDQLWLRA